jgi:hypothetical protein
MVSAAERACHRFAQLTIATNMALSAKFSLLHSEFNDFLFAQMGEEESGATLSVLSALTQLGIAGARLSDLPKDIPARPLVPMIAKFPKVKCGSSEVRALAERLVALLPQRRACRRER